MTEQHKQSPQKPAPKPKNDERESIEVPRGPLASVPPRLGGFASAPIAASPAQRAKRRGRRNGAPAAQLTTTIDGNEGRIVFYGSIGEDWYGEGITDDRFKQSLDDLGDVSTIRILMNSGGGDVFHATAIYNMLRKHPAEVIIEIEGVAASAATLVSMAADRIEMAENAHFMIHQASGIVWGTSREVAAYVKLLDNADSLLRLTYHRRTGLEIAELENLMDHDNWLTADEAHEMGFVDVIQEAKSVEPVTTPTDTTHHRPNLAATNKAAAVLAELSAMLNASPSSRVAASATPPLPPPAPLGMKGAEMDKELRARCVLAGMDASLSDADAQKWLNANLAAVAAVQPQPVAAGDQPLTAADIINLMDERDRRQMEARSKFRNEVDSLVALAFDDEAGFPAPAGLVDRCYDMQIEGIEATRKVIQDAKAEQRKAVAAGDVRISVPREQPRDRHVAAMAAGVALRGIRQNSDLRNQSADKLIERHIGKVPEDAEQFAQMPLLRLAEECLVSDGYSDREVRRMNSSQVAQAALGYREQAGVQASAGLHTTASLSIVTQDAVNKTLQMGYEEAPSTWRGPGRQAASVQDFKTIHRVKLSAAGNLPVWNDNTEPNQSKLSNEQETYAVEARAETLSFSWRTIVNDDMDIITRSPQRLGDAAARTVNAVFWNVVTSNPTMSDGQALFSTATGNRKRANLTTGAGAPSVSTVGTLTSLMRLMRGLNTPEGNESEDVLNITPSYIVGCAALETTILQLVRSIADPASGGNSGVYNTASTLIPVIEPLLDVDSSTAWYLFASPVRIDTIEVTFLAGQESPIVVTHTDQKTMSQNFTIVQTFNAAAIDHRGVQKHAGA